MPHFWRDLNFYLLGASVLSDKEPEYNNGQTKFEAIIVDADTALFQAAKLEDICIVQSF